MRACLSTQCECGRKFALTRISVLLGPNTIVRISRKFKSSPVRHLCLDGTLNVIIFKYASKRH